MRRLTLILFLLFCALPSVFAQKEYLPAWQEGYMDIHHIATGKGENSFLVFPDGTTMLVDCGDETHGRFKCDAYPDSSRTPGQWVAQYIRHFSAGTPCKEGEVDYFELSHFHSDHMGSLNAMRPGEHYGLCGVTDVCESIRFGKMVDRAYPDYSSVTSNKGVVPEYAKCIAWQRDKRGTVVERFVPGSHRQFVLKHNPKAYRKVFDVFNVASCGYLATGKGLKTRPMFREDPSKYDENMMSNVFIVSYGRFRYYSGGDLGGGVANGGDNHWRDFESQVADAVGPVTAMKANHHGWKEVMNPYLLCTMKPQVIAAICSHVSHPWKTTVQRIQDLLLPVHPELYLTTDSGRSQVGEELFAKLPPQGHIVLRVYEGGRSYQVFVLDARSTDYPVLYKTPVREL